MTTKDSLYDIIDWLGQLGFIQFVDLNAHEQPFNLLFSSMIKHTSDVLWKIEIIEKKCVVYGIPIVHPWKYIVFKEARDYLKMEMNCAPHMMFKEIQKKVD